jgi:hypothetical protein
MEANQDQDVVAQVVGVFFFLLITIILGVVVAEITGSVTLGAWAATLWGMLLPILKTQGIALSAAGSLCRSARARLFRRRMLGDTKPTPQIPASVKRFVAGIVSIGVLVSMLLLVGWLHDGGAGPLGKFLGDLAVLALGIVGARGAFAAKDGK